MLTAMARQSSSREAIKESKWHHGEACDRKLQRPWRNTIRGIQNNHARYHMSSIRGGNKRAEVRRYRARKWGMYHFGGRCWRVGEGDGVVLGAAVTR